MRVAATRGLMRESPESPRTAKIRLTMASTARTEVPRCRAISSLLKPSAIRRMVSSCEELNSLSGVRTEDEGLFVLQHKYWQDTMIQALKDEQQLIPVEAVQ